MWMTIWIGAIKIHASIKPWNQGDTLVVEKVRKDDEGFLDLS